MGYTSPSEAEAAVAYWNNTYVGSTKITAEPARSKEEELNTNYKKRKPVAEDAIITAAKRRKSNENDPKFAEFLRLNQPQSKTKTFLNDDGDFAQQAPAKEASEEEEEYQELEKPEETYEVVEHDEQEIIPAIVPDDADDSEWLRTRTSRTLDLHESAPAQVVKVSKPKTKPEALNDFKNDIEVAPEPVIEEVDEKKAAIQQIQISSRLFLRNLATSVESQALQELFSSYGDVEEVHIPQTKDGQSKSIAFVSFSTASAAIAAYTELDGKQFQGRLLHIHPAQEKLVIEKPSNGTKQNVGEKRKEERRKTAAKQTFTWNSLYLNQDAVMENTAKRFGVEKSALIDPTQSSTAITMALAESSALTTIKKFFKEHGVNLESFAETKQKDDSVLLFKNLPSHANEHEIRRLVEDAGGSIKQIVMPEIGGIAIVEVLDSVQGKIVFGKLAYRKYGDTLLYLEKGPVNTFNSAARSSGKDVAEPDAESEETDSATVFVKNLSWTTRSPGLTKVFESLKGFRSASVRTKADPKNPAERLSMGFGFVEFSTQEEAKSAIAALQGFKLDDHALELKISNGRISNKTKAAPGKTGTKVVVKNLPFETTKSDIQRLFATYGTLKSLRLPKKFDSRLRGFAFLEFVSKREAANAIQALTGVHLLGRRLVLQYADSELIGDEGVDQLINKTSAKSKAIRNLEAGQRNVERVELQDTNDEMDGLNGT